MDSIDTAFLGFTAGISSGVLIGAGVIHWLYSVTVKRDRAPKRYDNLPIMADISTAHDPAIEDNQGVI